MHSHRLHAQDMEGIKRAREEYQILLCGQPQRKSQRIARDGTGGAAAATATRSPRDGDVTPLPEGGAAASPLSGTCTVFPRPSVVELTRADTGKVFSFVFTPSVSYAWDRRGEFYRSLVGERVGYELQELVKASVTPHIPDSVAGRAPSHAAFLSPAPVSAKESHRAEGNEESDDSMQAPTLPCHAPVTSPLCPPVGGGAGAKGADSAGGYYFELSQTSRTLQPPPVVASFNSVRDGEAVWYSHSTPALVVDCLVRCASEEAQLVDAGAWAFLYKGRHLHTEAGKDMLGRDLLHQASRADGAGSSPALTAPVVSGRHEAVISLCAFRRF